MVVGQLRLPAADTVDQGHAEAVVGAPQIAVVLRVEPHERRALDLYLEALRMEHRVGAVAEDRGPAAERRIPQGAVRDGGVEGIGRGVAIHNGANPRLLRPGEVARVDEVVGHELPEPWPRRPQVVEPLWESGTRHCAFIRTARRRLVGHVEDDRPAGLRGRQQLQWGLSARFANRGRLLQQRRERIAARGICSSIRPDQVSLRPLHRPSQHSQQHRHAQARRATPHGGVRRRTARSLSCRWQWTGQHELHRQKRATRAANPRNPTRVADHEHHCDTLRMCVGQPQIDRLREARRASEGFALKGIHPPRLRAGVSPGEPGQSCELPKLPFSALSHHDRHDAATANPPE